MKNEYKTAGFFRRLFARALDSIILFSIIPPIIVFTSFQTANVIDFDSNFFIFILLFVLVVSVMGSLVYTWFFIYKYGGTLGKILFGLRIVDANGNYVDKPTAFWRFTVGYIISSSFVYLGFLWIFRKKENLAWHDRILDTRVITVGKPFMGILWLVLLMLLDVLMFFSFALYLLSHLTLPLL